MTTTDPMCGKTVEDHLRGLEERLVGLPFAQFGLGWRGEAEDERLHIVVTVANDRDADVIRQKFVQQPGDLPLSIEPEAELAVLSHDSPVEPRCSSASWLSRCLQAMGLTHAEPAYYRPSEAIELTGMKPH